MTAWAGAVYRTQHAARSSAQHRTAPHRWARRVQQLQPLTDFVLSLAYSATCLRSYLQHDEDDANQGCEGVQVTTTLRGGSSFRVHKRGKNRREKSHQNTNTAHRDTLALHLFLLLLSSDRQAAPDHPHRPCRSAGSGLLKSCGQDGIWSCTETT